VTNPNKFHSSVICDDPLTGFSFLIEFQVTKDKSIDVRNYEMGDMTTGIVVTYRCDSTYKAMGNSTHALYFTGFDDTENTFNGLSDALELAIPLHPMR
jgi:hypothetical protein